MTLRQYHRFWAAAAWAVIIFTLAPVLIVLLGSFTDKAYLSLPFNGASLRWYVAIFNYPQFFDGFVKSVQLALFAAVVATGLGTSAAIALSRMRSGYAVIISTLLLLPLMVPSVIVAVALVEYFNRLNTKPYIALFVGHIVITLPYVIRTVSASLSQMQRNIEWAAANLGATPWQVTCKITLPSIRPGVIGGLIFAFVVSFDAVTISIFLQSPTYTPLPVRLYNFIEDGLSPVIGALSTFLILFSALGIYAAERITGLNVIFGMRR